MATETAPAPKEEKKPSPVFHFDRPNSLHEDQIFAGLGDTGWYFLDETGFYAQGPYETQVLAEEKYCEYVRWLNTPPAPPARA